MEVVILILNLFCLILIGVNLYSLFVINRNILEMKNSFDQTNVIFRTNLEEDRKLREMQTKILSGISKKVRTVLDQ